MDQIKIGRFIQERRKENGLTQMQLAELLGITDRAISKWETGRALPDSSIMLDLCKILKISVNDLLSGEIITMENYNKETENKLVELVKAKEERDKSLLMLEIVIGCISVFAFLALTLVAAFIEMPDYLRVILIISGLIPFLIGMFFALRIEQTAGYYECKHCKHKYVPTYNQVLRAMHFGRTRYMKCPKCGKYSWQKKVISNDAEQH